MFSVVHFVEAEKALFFGDKTARSDILNTWNPFEALRIGQSIKNFDMEQWEKM